MSMHPQDFPRWLAGVAARPVDASAHRRAVVRTMSRLVGPDATATILARSGAFEPRPGRPAANDSRVSERLAA